MRLTTSTAAGYPLAQSLRVGVVTLQNFSLYNSSAFQIGHMLGLINHVAGSVLGAPHLGLRIVRVLPLFIARLASRPILIEAAHRGLILGVNAFLFRQFLHILPIGLFRITMHQSAQTRIGFDHARIDPQMPTFEKPVRLKRREHHLENPLVNLRPEPLPNHTQAAVIGRALFQTVSQKRPHRQAVLTARRDRSFAAQVFEKPDHKHFEIDHRINPRSPAPALFPIGRLAQRPNLTRKIHRLPNVRSTCCKNPGSEASRLACARSKTPVASLLPVA